MVKKSIESKLYLMLMHVLPNHSLQVRDRFVNPRVCVAARYVRRIPAHIEQTRAAPPRAHLIMFFLHARAEVSR